MAGQARSKKNRGLAGGNRLHEAAEAAARVGGLLFRPREGDPADTLAVLAPAEDSLRDALAEARRRLREVEEGHARSLARAARRWEKERAALEAQMTGLVQEIGAAKHIVERVGELEAEVERLRSELAASERSARDLDAERSRLRAEIEALRPGAPAVAALEGANPAGARAARAAAAGVARRTA